MEKETTTIEAQAMENENPEKAVAEVELDLALQLPKDAKWVCVGKRSDGQVALFIPYINKWDGDELCGFIDRSMVPEALKQTINEQIGKKK